MQFRALLPDLPPAYEVLEGRNGVLACRAGWREDLLALGLGPDGPAPTSSAEEGGPHGSTPRGRLPVTFLEARGVELVVRRYHHGGVFRWLGRERFGDPARPFRELGLSAALIERGIPTPEIVAARAQRVRPGWRLLIVSRRVQGAVDGSAVLRGVRDGSLAPGTRHGLVRAAGGLVGRMHAAGLWHADLTPENLLVAEEALHGAAPVLWVLDLDRSRLASELSDHERRQNLERLFRAVKKRQQRFARRLALSDASRFLRAYTAALGRPAAAWRAEWHGQARLERRGRLAHRAAWRLERLFRAPNAP